MEISNSNILIIGGGSGLGLGIAKECNKNGAQVVIASRSEEKLQHAVNEMGKTAKFEIVDISSKESIKALFNKVGHIDHLVVTSGFVTGKNFNDLPEEDARSDFETNFWGKFSITKYGSKYINKGGSITFISGAFAKKTNPSVFITSVSVVAVEAMAKTLAISLSPIRVNVISPYVVDTNLAGSEQNSDERKRHLESIADSLPSKCIGSPKNIGDAAVFLMTNPYVTGSVLSIDGGFTII